MDAFSLASGIGSVAFALSGFLLGVRKQLDLMGLFIVAMLTANGGGALRDVLVGKTPNVLVDISAFWLVFCVVVLAFVVKIHKYTGLERRLVFVLSDSVGLVAFSITGALVGLEAELNFFGVMALAFLTATGGGMLRDIIVNEVPALLDSGFYGSVALLIAASLYALDSAGWLTDSFILLVFVGGLCLRLVAHFHNWHLPRIQKGKPYLGDAQGE